MGCAKLPLKSPISTEFKHLLLYRHMLSSKCTGTSATYVRNSCNVHLSNHMHNIRIILLTTEHMQVYCIFNSLLHIRMYWDSLYSGNVLT